MKDDRLYLIHINECITRIQQYVTAGRDEFLASSLIQDATLRNLQILTESTQRLSEQIKHKHADVDWKGIAAFRNVVVHDYLGLDMEQVWQIVCRDLPALLDTVEGLLTEPLDNA